MQMRHFVQQIWLQKYLKIFYYLNLQFKLMKTAACTNIIQSPSITKLIPVICTESYYYLANTVALAQLKYIPEINQTCLCYRERLIIPLSIVTLVVNLLNQNKIKRKFQK